ncbi:MAG: hypothetical protein ACUVST_14300 [Anaerolineae bacterium]
MLENSPRTRRFSPDRLFPLIALALVVVLTAGLMGVGGYLLLGRGGRGAPEVQAKGLAERTAPTVWAPLPTVVPSPTPSPRPTHTPVVQATATVETALVASEGTPLPTPTESASTPEATAVAQGEQVPQTGLGVLESAGMAGVLLAFLAGVRGIRRRTLP